MDKNSKFRKEKFITDSGIEIPEYLSESKSIEPPGDYPYTRGVHKSMYRARFWTMRQYAGFATAEESNKRYKYLISNGTTGLSVAFDLPTQIGYDSDAPQSEGEVGKVGVAIDSLRDMETLFDGINLQDVTTSMTINSTASILLMMYVAIAKKQKAELKKISGTIQNDLLKEYIARGTYIYPPKESMRLITDIFAWCSENLPSWNTISISGYHIREAGSDAAQEVAFTFSNGIEYVNAAIKAGLNVDKFAKRLSFFFNAHNNFLEEIAKFRAARRIWAKIMKERFGARDEASMKLRFHAQTAGCTLSDKQIDNNVVRVTVQALAAVLGGCQSLHTNSKDEALSLPTEESVQTALRTQQIIAYESGVADTVDAFGGSYVIEYLTEQMEKKVWAYLDKIDQIGGGLKAIEQGFQMNEIERSSYDYQLKIEKEEQIIVGVNKFLVDEHTSHNLLKIDDEIRNIQIKKIQVIRETRDNIRVNMLLDNLKAKAKTDENLLPYILDCIESYVTLGEISNAFRSVWGEYRT